MTSVSQKSKKATPVLQYCIGKSSIGLILVAASDVGMCAVMMGDKETTLTKELQHRFPKAELSEGNKAFIKSAATVLKLAEHPAQKFSEPLDVHGTTFQKKVWKALQEIPAGQTATYKDIAKKIKMPKASRAIAQACGANKIAIIIPCHRVIRSDGSLSGYRWGVERKAALLKREQRK